MFWNRNRLLKQILKETESLKQEIRKMSSNTGQGLAALQQADTDLAAAVTTQTQVTQTAVAAIQASLANLGQSEDPAVAAEAAKIEAAVALINQSNTNLTSAVATLPTAAPSA